MMIETAPTSATSAERLQITTRTAKRSSVFAQVKADFDVTGDTVLDKDYWGNRDLGTVEMTSTMPVQHFIKKTLFRKKVS